MDSENDPPFEGVDILDDESDSNDYFPGIVTDSEKDDSVTIGSDADTLTSPEPTVHSEGARCGIGPAKYYPTSRWEHGANGKMRLMGIYDSKIEGLASLCPVTYPLTCGPNLKQVNPSRICRSCKRKNYRKRLCEQNEVVDSILNSTILDDLPDIEVILKSPL